MYIFLICEYNQDWVKLLKWNAKMFLSLYMGCKYCIFFADVSHICISFSGPLKLGSYRETPIVL